MGRIELKTAQELRFMREAGLVVAGIHEKLREAVRPGVTTAELDAVSSDAIAAAGAASNFLGYYDYPATVCVSVNDVVVHGIPGGYRLRARPSRRGSARPRNRRAAGRTRRARRCGAAASWTP